MNMHLVTVAIHTYEKALALRSLLESEGIAVELNNVYLESPSPSPGVRVRIGIEDLPRALHIIENVELYTQPGAEAKATRNVLVPVDFSEMSFKAAMVAARLAVRQQQPLQFLYSYIDPYIAGNIQLTDTLSYEVGEPGARHALGENARRMMDNFCERFRMSMKQSKSSVTRYGGYVCEGVPEDVINDYAKAHVPSLIVMGTRGVERKEREMVGSVTAQVIDEGRFPVLTVPESFPVDKSLNPSNILFFSNVDQDDILAIDMLYRLFGNHDANVTIVNMPSRKRMSHLSAVKALGRLCDYCTNTFNGYHFETVPITEADFDNEFDSLNNRYHLDLIVVPNHRRNALSRLFNPSLAQRLLRNDIPMLIIPV